MWWLGAGRLAALERDVTWRKASARAGPVHGTLPAVRLLPTWLPVVWIHLPFVGPVVKPPPRIVTAD